MPNSIIEKAKVHCLQVLQESRCSEFAFHNTQHTKDVFEFAEKIGKYENLSNQELTIVMLAALFHDTGNIDCFQGHEDVSAQRAVDYLSNTKLPQKDIEQIVACILVTKMPQTPKNKLEEIICDADLAHLGSPEFIKKNQQLRKEWKNQLNMYFTTQEWLHLNCKFLENHRYFTHYGKKFLEPQKQKSIEVLKSRCISEDT